VYGEGLLVEVLLRAAEAAMKEFWPQHIRVDSRQLFAPVPIELRSQPQRLLFALVQLPSKSFQLVIEFLLGRILVNHVPLALENGLTVEFAQFHQLVLFLLELLVCATLLLDCFGG